MFKANAEEHPTLLSIYLVQRGFAFVLFQGPLVPHDWGIKEVKRDITGATTVEAVREFLDRYRPEVLVLDDPRDHRTSTRSEKVTRINKALARYVGRIGAGIAVVSRQKVRKAFARYGAVNKHDVAKVIGERLDAFATRMPRKRTRWGKEDTRMGLFDAASRALAYYQEHAHDEALG